MHVYNGFLPSGVRMLGLALEQYEAKPEEDGQEPQDASQSGTEDSRESYGGLS